MPHVENLFAAVVGIGVILTLARAIYRIAIPFQIDYAEGPILHTASRLAKGGNLYPPVTTPPYEIDSYPPIIYHLVEASVRTFGVSLLYPRLMTLLSALLICVLLSVLVHVYTKSWKTSLTFGFLFFTIPIVQPWLSIVRFDMVGLALALCGLVLFIVYPRYWYLSVIPFSMAVCGLYTLIAAPAACFWCLLIGRQWKKALVFGFSIGFILIGIFWLQQLRTGDNVSFHLFHTQHSPYSLSQLGEMAQTVLRTHAVVFILGFGVIWLCVTDRKLAVPALYLGFASLTSLTLGKIGATDNHLLQILVAACWSSGIVYQWMRQNLPNDVGLGLLTLALIFAVVTNTPFRPGKKLQQVAECGKAYSAIKNNLGDRILGENIAALVMGDRQVYVSDPFIYRWLVAKGGWPDIDLKDRIVSHFFTAIVTNRPVEGIEGPDDRWPDSIRSSIRENYTLTEQFVCRDAGYVYQPNNGQIQRPSGLDQHVSNQRGAIRP
jgi:hypothetical protein